MCTASSSQDRIFEECLVRQAERRVWEIKFLHLEPPNLAFVSKAKAGRYKHFSMLRKRVEPAGREAVLLASSLFLTHVAIHGPNWHERVGKCLCKPSLQQAFCYSGCGFLSYFLASFCRKEKTYSSTGVTCNLYQQTISNIFQAVGCVKVRMVHRVV